MSTNQPTILVKKSDGTSVRMSWDDFELYRKQNTRLPTPEGAADGGQAANRMQTASDETPKSELPAKIGEEAVATTAPVKEIFVDEAKYVRTYEKDTRLPEPEAQADGGQAKLRTTNSEKVERLPTKDQKIRRSEDQRLKMDRPAIEKVKKDWTADDGKSLLEDSIDETMKAKATSILPSKRDDLYDLFIKEIRFPIKDELRGRLNSLAVSFVKGVRTEDQMRGYLQRSEADGGLGFSDGQIEAVIGAIKKVWHLTNTPPAPLREGSLDVPSSEEGGGGVRTHPSHLSERGNLRSTAEGDDHKLPPRRRAGEVLAVNAKPLVQDVTPPKPKIIEQEEKISMGPIDEIASMTLTDFRRLATGGADSIQVLRGKLSALRKESVIIYLQALDAWFASPVYKEYQNLIKRAVNERRKMQEVVGESGIKFEEFIKLAEVGRGI